jgi:putative NADPH-quinone reductase
MSTSILLFHPEPARSQANRALATAAGTLADVEIVDMAALYPSVDSIDADAEVARLVAADRLILQFPVQWYSTPPLLKAWQDLVLTRMFYIRPQEGESIRDLPLMVAATAGNDRSAYTPDGANLFALEALLRPLQATAYRCGLRWADPFLLFRANKSSPEELAAAGRAYATRISAWRAGDTGRRGWR